MASKLHGLASLALRSAGVLSAVTGGDRRLSILVYHRVLPHPDSMLAGEVEAASFDWQMGLLTEHFQVLPLSEAVARLRNGTLPARAACVTFDDGYADNYEVALPILQKWGVPATFFIATGFMNGGWMWNDAVIEAARQAPGDMLDLAPLGMPPLSLATPVRRCNAASAIIARLKYLPSEERSRKVDDVIRIAGATLPTGPMMAAGQIRALHNAGMEIGGHTDSHPILSNLSLVDAYAEIGEGKAKLEMITRGTVRLFAYPNGKPDKDYRPEHVDMIKRMGFIGAVSTTWGAADAATDPHQLPRFTPWDGTPLRFGLRLLQNTRREMELARAAG